MIAESNRSRLIQQNQLLHHAIKDLISKLTTDSHHNKFQSMNNSFLKDNNPTSFSKFNDSPTIKQKPNMNQTNVHQSSPSSSQSQIRFTEKTIGILQGHLQELHQQNVHQNLEYLLREQNNLKELRSELNRLTVERKVQEAHLVDKKKGIQRDEPLRIEYQSMRSQLSEVKDKNSQMKVKIREMERQIRAIWKDLKSTPTHNQTNSMTTSIHQVTSSNQKGKTKNAFKLTDKNKSKNNDSPLLKTSITELGNIINSTTTQEVEDGSAASAPHPLQIERQTLSLELERRNEELEQLIKVQFNLSRRCAALRTQEQLIRDKERRMRAKVSEKLRKEIQQRKSQTMQVTLDGQGGETSEKKQRVRVESIENDKNYVFLKKLISNQQKVNVEKFRSIGTEIAVGEQFDASVDGTAGKAEKRTSVEPNKTTRIQFIKANHDNRLIVDQEDIRQKRKWNLTTNLDQVGDHNKTVPDGDSNNNTPSTENINRILLRSVGVGIQ